MFFKKTNCQGIKKTTRGSTIGGRNKKLHLEMDILRTQRAYSNFTSAYGQREGDLHLRNTNSTKPQGMY